MRAISILGLSCVLSACAAGSPAPSGPLPGHVSGKADGAGCGFGPTVDEMMSSGLFEVGEETELRQLSDDELAALLRGTPPGVDSEEAIRAWVDDGEIFRYDLWSDVTSEVLHLYFYAVDESAGGFIVRPGSTDILAYILDGRFEDCSYGLGGPTAEGQCLFGETWDDLLAADVSIHDPQTLAGAADLSDEQLEQLGRAFPTGMSTEQIFEYVDDGQIETETLVSESTDHDAFTAYWWQVEGQQQGVVYTIESLDRVASVVDERVTDCTVTVPAAPADGGCLFGETAGDLVEAMVYGGEFSYGDDVRLTATSELTEMQQRQLGSVAPVGGGIGALFEMSDDGTIEIGTLVSTTTDHDPFTFYSFNQDDAEAGYLFTMDSLELIARIQAGAFVECTVAGGAPSADDGAAAGPY